tara:strand:+ start:2016 stop:3134 length:1119 start_codon:yes stop_codon:yes gene_type:complete
MFVDSIKGYATQENKLLSTLDGGNSWHLVDSLSHQSNQNKTYFGMITKVADSIFVSSGNLTSSFILKIRIDSTNLSLDSNIQDGRFLRDYSFINRIFFGIDSSQAFVAYNQNIKQTHYSYASSFSVDQNRILVADYANLYSSIDLGLTWDTISLPTPSTFVYYSPNEIIQINSDTFCVRYIGYPTDEYITLNGGLSWQIHDTVYSIPKRRPNTLNYLKYATIIGNFNNIFLYSNDLGFNFYSDTITSSTSRYNMAFFKTYANKWGTVFIYGDSGKIYKTTNYDRITLLNEKKLHIPKIVLSPNPTQSSFSFSNSLCHDISQLRIYNQKGQLVKQNNKPCHETDVSDLKSGVYLVSGVYKGKMFSSKLLVQNE